MEQLRIEIRPGVGTLDPAAWDALSADTNPFLSHAFLSTLERTGCLDEASGWVPQILCAFADDALVGALPLYLKFHSRGEFVFDWSWAEAAHRAGIPYYPKAVVAVPFSPVTGARVLVRPEAHSPAVMRALVRAAIALADQAGLSSLHFNFIRPEDRALFAELGLPIRAGIQYQWQNHDPVSGAPYTDFDGFLGAFRAKRRATIRRERRELQRAGVRARVLRGDELTDEVMRRMHRYYADTVDKFFYGERYLNEAFFVEIARAMPGALHLMMLEQEGEPFGGAFNLVDDTHLFGRYWGCERQVRFAHFEACIYAPVTWAIAQGLQVFEPGAGGDHKYERGFTPTATYSAHYIRDQRLRLAIQDFLAQEHREVDTRIDALRQIGPLKEG
ncbi:GNAT family N-acetyltransferase [Lujinxingia litoralis]|nr:GNAT family N-acetyltransferase [Lujinxingia litoralis]